MNSNSTCWRNCNLYHSVEILCCGTSCMMLGKIKITITQGSRSIPNWILWTQVEAVNTIDNSIMDFYSKTNQMHSISNLFYFGTTLYMFRTVSPSIIRSRRLYIQHQVYVIQVLWLLASRNEFHLIPTSKQPQNLYDTYLMLYVQP